MIQITGDEAWDSSGVTHVLDAGDVPDGLGVHEVFDEPKYQAWIFEYRNQKLRLLGGYFRYLPPDGD